MARVDKTESAVGVTRGTLLADVVQADWGKPIGVSVNSAGLTVRGATGTSGMVGVIIADKTNYRAGSRCDIIGNGSELVDVVGLTPGIPVYGDNVTGLLVLVAAGATKVGYTQEADRLVVTL